MYIGIFKLIHYARDNKRTDSISRSAAYTLRTLYYSRCCETNENRRKKRVIINLEPRGICERIIIIKKILLLLQGEFRFQNADVLE